MIKIDKGAIDLHGNKMELSVDLSVIITALIDKMGFDKALLKKCLNIGIREAGKPNLWEDADDKD